MAVPPATDRADRATAARGLRAAAVFALLAIAVTWVVWIPRALAPDQDGAIVAVGNAWTYGPAIAAVLAAALTTGRAGLRELGRRLTRWRVGPVWWAVVLLGPAALWLVVLGVHVALGGSADEARPLAVEAGAASVLPLLLLLCLTDGVGEETGWRGYALPRLLEELKPVPAAARGARRRRGRSARPGPAQRPAPLTGAWSNDDGAAPGGSPGAAPPGVLRPYGVAPTVGAGVAVAVGGVAGGTMSRAAASA